MKRCLSAFVFFVFFATACLGQTITSVSPSSADVGTELSVTITCSGDDFLTCSQVISWTTCNSNVSRVYISNGDSSLVASSVSGVQAASLTADFGIPLSCPSGAWSLAVDNNNGSPQTLVQVQGFTINSISAPVVQSVTPSSSYQDTTVTVTIAATHAHFRLFQQTSSVDNVTNIWLKQGTSSIKADSVRPSGYDTVRAYFSLTSTNAPGLYDVQVDQGGGLASALMHNAFTIKSLAPDSTVPVLVPCQPKVTLNLRPVFLWHKVTGATTYTLAVASDVAFASIQLQMPLSDTSYAPQADIPVGPVFWRVKSDISTGWSRCDNFIIQSDTVPFIVRFSGDSVHSKRPHFVWNKVALATAYRIEIAQTQAFGNGVSMPVQDTSFDPLADMTVGSYYWHVSCDRNYSIYCPIDSLVVAPSTRAIVGDAKRGTFGVQLASLANRVAGWEIWVYALNGKRAFIIPAANIRSTIGESVKASGGRLLAGVYLAVLKKNGVALATERYLQH